MILTKFGWNWPSGSGEEDFFKSSIHFCNFLIISPWKRAEPLIGTNLKPLHPRMLESLVEIRSVALEKIFEFHQCIFAFSLLSPLGKGCGPSFELESSWPKNALCQDWLKLAQSSGEEDENVKSLWQRKRGRQQILIRKSSFQPLAQVDYKREVPLLRKSPSLFLFQHGFLFIIALQYQTMW